MKPKAFATSLALFSAACGGLIGYQLGQNSRPPSQAGAVSQSVTARSSHSLATPAAGPSEEADPLAGRNEGASSDRRRLSDRISAALSHESHRRQNYEVERLFEDLRPEDAPTILSQLLAWPNPRERRGMLRPFFLKWAELDGPTALQAAEQLAGRERNESISAAYAGWAASDPYAAWDKAKPYLTSLPPHMAFQLRGVVHELAKRDLTVAIGIINEESDPRRSGALGNMVVNAAFEANQAGELVRRIDSVEDMEKRKQWISQIFRQWGELDTQQPLDALATISDPSLAADAMTGFLQGWAQEDPRGALDFALENGGDPLVSEALGPLVGNSIFQNGAEQNKVAIAKVVAAGRLDEIASEIVGPLGMSDPQHALQVAGMVSDDDYRRSLQGGALIALARNDLEAAEEFIHELPAASDKAHFLPSLAWQLGEREDGGERLTELMASIPAGEDRTKAVEQLLGHTDHPRYRPNPAYLQAIAGLASAEPGLSEEGIAQRDKLLKRVSGLDTAPRR